MKKILLTILLALTGLSALAMMTTMDDLGSSGSLRTLSLPEITATAAELNALDGVTASVAELNIMDGITATFTEINVLDASAIAGETGVTIVETGGIVKQAVLTVSGVELIIDGSSGAGWGAAQLATLPEGRIFVLGVVVDGLAITGDGADLSDGAGGDYSLGSTATSDNTLAGTDVDLCPSTSLDPIQTGVDSALADETAHLDGTSSAVEIHANFLVDDGDVAASSTNTIAYVVTVTYIDLGDL